MENSPKKFHQVLKAIDEIPALPEVYNRLMASLRNPETSAEDIAKIIATDPGLSSKVLKVVNSAFYGFATQTTSISRAVVVLGFNEVRNLVITTSVVGTFLKGNEQQMALAKELWRHGLAVAVLSKILARRMELQGHEDLFVAGLLHDVGKLVHLTSIPNDFGQVMDEARIKAVPFHKIEREMLGFDHTFTARVLLKNWQLQPALKFMVSRHHSPKTRKLLRKHVAVVHLSDVLAHFFKLADLEVKQIPKINKLALALVGMKLDELLGLEKEAHGKLDDICAVLDVA
ncbi:MAG: HDOD domain-containing protein [Planctomycetota bacterium]